MRVYACVWFRDDCLSLLVALYSETACKDSINNWNMQTFFYFFMVFYGILFVFHLYSGKEYCYNTTVVLSYYEQE